MCRDWGSASWSVSNTSIVPAYECVTIWRRAGSSHLKPLTVLVLCLNENPPLGQATAELQPGLRSLFFQVPSDQSTVRGTDQRGLGGCTRMEVVLKKTQVSTARFRSSTCLNMTLCLALPSFFPPAFCAQCEWLSSPPTPTMALWGGGRQGAIWNSLESLPCRISPGLGMAIGSLPAEPPGETFSGFSPIPTHRSSSWN